MSWIDVVMSNYEESEAPKKFFYWSALTAISAVVKKQIFLDRFIYKLYPNIYVFLIAGSGMKKGIPISMAKSLVTKSGSARIIAGRNSMPKIIQELGKAKSLEGGGIIKDAQAFLISGELAAFLVKDPDALTTLTDLHNTHEHEEKWENSLKGTGVDVLKSPCLTLLGATNEEHFDGMIIDRDIKGGFIARTFIVLSNEKGKLNSLTQAPKIIPNIDYLSLYLKELAKLTGEFQWKEKAKLAYDDWYYNYMSKQVRDPTGSNNRIGDQILKVAMLLSLAECPNMEIRESHIVEAISVSIDCLTGMKQVTMGAGKVGITKGTVIFLKYLIETKDFTVSRQKMMERLWPEGVTDFDLDRIAETLSSSDAIDIIGAGGKNTSYRLKKSALEMYQKTVRSIQ